MKQLIKFFLTSSLALTIFIGGTTSVLANPGGAVLPKASVIILETKENL